MTSIAHAGAVRARGTTPGSRQDGTERGAALVEAMLVMPALLLFVFGILEYGLATSDWLATGNATRDGAREASVSGDFLQADYNILQAIDKATAAIPDEDIRRIVVFRADGPDNPAECTTGGSVEGNCNVYTAEHLSWEQSEFGCDKTLNPREDPDWYWCPTDRNDEAGTADHIGIYIKVRHDFATGLFGDGIDLSDTTIFRIEPTER